MFQLLGAEARLSLDRENARTRTLPLLPKAKSSEDPPFLLFEWPQVLTSCEMVKDSNYAGDAG